MGNDNDNKISPPNVTGFVHLHLHTEYSLLDGAIRLKDLPDRLADMGMTSCAITDHGVMYGVVDFYRRMKAKGLHPIIGCELYVATDNRFNRNYAPNEKAYNHLILLAISHRPQFTHTQLGHHRTGQLTATFNIIGSTGSDVIKFQFFRGASAHQGDHFRQQLFL